MDTVLFGRTLPQLLLFFGSVGAPWLCVGISGFDRIAATGAAGRTVFSNSVWSGLFSSVGLAVPAFGLALRCSRVDGLAFLLLRDVLFFGGPLVFSLLADEVAVRYVFSHGLLLPFRLRKHLLLVVVLCLHALVCMH